MKHQIPLLAGLIVCASLLFPSTGQAQLPWRLFGPKTDKSKTALPDPRRALEINVEIAWLADPITFPYYLEAHADSKKLDVRGYVPNKAVREHAMRIAQIYSSLPVADAIKEHANLVVKPTQMAPAQLQSSVQASLRVALPKQAPQLRIECGADGKVFISGPVNNLEERLIASQALRRLHGCTSVENLTTLPAESSTAAREKLPIVTTSNSSERTEKAAVDSKSKWTNWFGKSSTTTEEPPLLEAYALKFSAKKAANPPPPVTKPEPEVVKQPEVVPTEAPPPPANTPPISVAELRSIIQKACPKVVGAQIELTAAREARVILEIRNEADLTPTAERLFALPELQNLRLDLQFKITPP